MYRSMISCLAMLLVVFPLLSGCAKIGAEDLATAAGAVGGAFIGTSLGLPPVGVAGTTGAGAISGAIIVGPPEQDPDVYKGDDGQWQFLELIAFAWVNFTQHLIGLGIVAALFFVVTGWLGMRSKRPEEKSMERQLQSMFKMMMDGGKQ